MSSNPLVIVQPTIPQAVPTEALALTGAGLDFKSPLFQLKPATININQPNTQAEGAIRGHLRIAETGDQFEFMDVALLSMPMEYRNYHVGEAGQLNRSNDNLMCTATVVRDQYRRELQGPSEKAKVPQAIKCATCPKADWSKWRQTKLKADLPQCETFYYALFIDTVYKMPLRMYIRSKSKEPFEAGMQNLARTFAKMTAAKLNPNIFDIRFKLSTRLIKTGALPSYVVNLSDFRPIAEEDRAAFGDVYLQFAKRDQAALEAPAADPVTTAAQTIDAQVVEPGTEGKNVIDGEAIQI